MSQQQPSESIEEQLSSLRTDVRGIQTEFDRKTNILLDEIIVLRDEMEGLTRRVSQIADNQQQLQEGQQQMQTAIVSLSNLMAQIAKAAEVNRVQLAQDSEADRTEIRRIWEYLESQRRTQGNGHGGW